MSNDPGNKETIRVKRRRQGASSGPQSDERAQAPRRERPSSGSGTPGGTFGGGTGGTGGTGGMGGLGGGLSRMGGKKMPIWLILLLAACYIIYTVFFNGGGGQGTDVISDLPTEDSFSQPTSDLSLPTSTRSAPRATLPAGTPGQTWTVMLYQDADDRILEQDIYLDLNEVERVGSTERVQIVSQFDRYKGAFSGDGDWTGTRRYHILQDEDLSRVRSELVTEMGEENMADGGTLADFVLWAANSYPADHYVLILSDHGMGWPGGFSDPDPVSQDSSRAPLASALEGDHLFLMELEATLADITSRANFDKFEIVGMDACLMGHMEVLASLEPYANYSVLSQETEPALGWAYTGFLQALVDNPDMSGAQLSATVVDSYIRDDQRIIDDQARADFLRQGSPLGGLFGSAGQMSAAALTDQLSKGITLTAVDMAGVPALMDSLNALAYNLQNENPEAVASARSYAPSFTNIFGKDTPSPYIDLGGFVQLLKRGGVSAATSQAADQVLAGIQDVIIAEKHGSGKRGATGISIYFPNSTLYRSPVAGPQSYTVIADRFAQESLWDNFLAYFFNNINFDADPTRAGVPEPLAPSRAPGSGDFSVSPIQLSQQTAAPNDPVTVTAEVSGSNIGYIYLFVGYYDSGANAIYKADTDYLESPNTEQVNDVFYPVWSENESFNLEFDWEPTLFQISDGENTSVALFNPQSYGASAEEAVYTVDGVYHYADGESRSARLYFRDGVMRQVFAFTDESQTGGVWEIIPEAGDSFTIWENWMDLDSSGQVTQTVTEEGATLTFGDQPFSWSEVYAAPGDYILGIIVQDLDGNSQAVYTTVTVE